MSRNTDSPVVLTLEHSPVVVVVVVVVVVTELKVIVVHAVSK